MLKLDIFNASLLLDEHGHPFLFYNLSSHMINTHWTKFEQKLCAVLFQGNNLTTQDRG